MNNERLDRALMNLRSASVTPTLVSDADLITNKRHPHLLWWLFGLSVVVMSVWYMLPTSVDVNVDERATSSINSKTQQKEPVAVVTTEDTTVTASTTSHATLDPRSILVLSLTDEELAVFGITRIGDTVIVPMQSLVVEDTDIARTLGLDSAQLSDTAALFHWSSRSFPGRVDSIKALSFDGTTLDHQSPIRVYSIKGNYIAPSAMIYPALVRTDLQDSLLGALMQARPSLYHAGAPHGGMLAMMPSATLRRDRKPIMIQVHTPGSEQRTQIEFMPTDAVLKSLPKRFEDAVSRCYSEFHPNKPTKRTVVMPVRASTIALVKIDGVIGQPVLDLDSASLMNFAVIKDPVSIRCRAFAHTIDRERTTFQRPTREDQPWPFFTNMLFIETETFRNVRLYPEASLSEVHFKGPRDTIIHISNMYTIGSAAPQNQNDWLDRYPKAKTFASEAIASAAAARIPIDSLPYYGIKEGSMFVPVSRLMLGLRIETPWASRPEWNGEERRLVRFNWYLPSQQTLDALPDHIRAFVQPEFEALYASIEQELTAKEMCELLDRPSAFGLCSINDTTIRIDGIGPIPARESFTVYVNSLRPMIASLHIIGDDGRSVLELRNITISQGANQIPVPFATENIPSGAYTVVLTTADGTRSSRVLIQR